MLPPDLFPKRLGNSSLSKPQKMVPSLYSLSTLDCESYQLGKHTCAFSHSAEGRSELIFSLVYSDIWGPKSDNSLVPDDSCHALGLAPVDLLPPSQPIALQKGI